MIPEDLRIPIWESEYMDKECERQNQTEDKIFQSFAQNMQQGRITGKNVNSERITKYVIEMHKHWPGLRDFEDKLGKQQLLAVRVLACMSQSLGEDSLHKLFWMIPLLDLYNSEETNVNKNDYVVKIAFRLSILIKRSKKEKNEIFELVDEIFEDLHNSDPDFFWHLNKISQDVSSIDMHKSVKESVRVWSNIIKSAKNLDERAKIPFINGGKIFVRRWICWCS